MMRSRGFTLFELLVVLGIIGVMWGLGMGYMPRLLSGSGPDDMARRLAGAGLEARQMAMLQQRPWEVLLDLDQGIYYTAPLGAVARRQLRGAPTGEAAAGVLLRTENPSDTATSLQAENNAESTTSLRKDKAYDISKTYSAADDNSDIREALLDEGARIVRVTSLAIHNTEGGQVSIVFSPRGVCRPTVVWLTDEESSEESYRTLYFPGLLPPRIERGRLITDVNGNLVSEEAP